MNRSTTRIKLSGSFWIRPLARFIFAALMLSIPVFYLQTSPFMRDMEYRFQTRFLLAGSFFSTPETSKTPVVVILINEQSLPEGTPRSPIDRKWLATTINRISSHHPQLIGLNILLDRPLEPRKDRFLADSIAGAGNVIIRSDPLYPALPMFSDAALDRGTMRFKADSSGSVQEACHSAISCRSSAIFHNRLLKYFLGEHYRYTPPKNGSGWLRINFSIPRATDAGQYIQTPVFYTHNLNRIPDGALRNKIVLVGTGFTDLYPLYRVPLPGHEQFIQETELLAQTIATVAENKQIEDLSPYITGLLVFAALSILSLLITRRGIFSGIWLIIVLVSGLFIIAAIALNKFQLAIPFIAPTSVLILFLAGGSVQQILQERFSRLMTELKLKQAKIDFLTNELHTHHLFNELSRLNVMISRQPEKARAYLVEFAELLRASLKYGDQPRVPVSIQLEYLKTYLQQQKIIHGDLFRFSITAHSNWEKTEAPWHVFFPLVENAVKAVEGILRQSPETPADITITMHRENKGLVFRVENPYSETEKGPSAEKGLLNLEDRLKWSYAKGGFSLTSGPRGKAWVAILQLPLL